MQPDAPTLLQTTLRCAPVVEDVERAWAFLLFCGVLDSRAHDTFVAAAAGGTGDGAALADQLLDFATQRAELLDPADALALRLWQYFQVGQSLQPERPLGTDPDEGTQPGVTSLVESLPSSEAAK